MTKCCMEGLEITKAMTLSNLWIGGELFLTRHDGDISLIPLSYDLGLWEGCIMQRKV